VDERLAIADLHLDLTRFAEQCTKLTRSPAGKGRLIFALEMMPATPRAFEASQRARTISASPRTYWRLIDEHDLDEISRRFCLSPFPRVPSRHPANLRTDSPQESSSRLIAQLRDIR
jgi:hypothetical protein